MAIARPITEKAILMEQVVDRATFAEMIRSGVHGRKGPVFVELPLDVQGAQVDEEKLATAVAAEGARFEAVSEDAVAAIIEKLKRRSGR